MANCSYGYRLSLLVSLYLFDPLSETCCLNDLNTDEGPPHSYQSVEAALVVTDENMFVDSDVNEQDESMSNKVKDAAGLKLCIQQGVHS